MVGSVVQHQLQVLKRNLEMAFLLVHLCLFLLLTATGLGNNDVPNNNEEEECLDRSAYTVDLLKDMKPKEPFLQESSPSPSSYAHLINSDTKGYVIVNKTLAGRVNTLSCSTKEIAISMNVVLLREGFQPLIQIANPRHDLEGEMLLIAIDTVNSTLFLSYHHQGRPQVVRLPFEVPIRKWFHFVFVFSHNQFQLVQDCSIALVQMIPTPDLCLPKSVTISIGEVTYSKQVSVFQGAVQNVYLIFGIGRYTSVCPTLDSSCTTCAEAVRMKMEIDALKKEKADLEKQVEDSLCSMATSSGLIFKDLSFFEDFREHRFVTYDLRRSPALNGVGEHKYSCLLQGKRYEPGEFFTHSFDVHVMDVSCMCFFGRMICSGGVQIDVASPVAECHIGEPFNTVIPLDTVITKKDVVAGRDECTVAECGDVTNPGPHIDPSMRCSSNMANVCSYEKDPDSSKRRMYHAAVCCGLCEPCKEGSCPPGIECVTDADHGNHTCKCPEGKYFEDKPTKQCININECMNRSACPEDSTCIDEEPGYQCRCTKKGFRWDRESNLCIDIDECAENSSLCPRFIKKCVNTDGGYRCNCSDGFQENAETGNCEAKCTPECQNGGQCFSGNQCICPPGSGFTGNRCENDIDECAEGQVCADETQECLNTAGSYVCRCKTGYRSNGTGCEDIDECADRSLHYCDKGKCENVNGSYKCMCRMAQMQYDCTGVCRALNHDWLHGQNFTNSKNCKLCVCLHGLTVCTPMACDCSDYNMARSQCCSQQCMNCTLPDGTTLKRGTQGTTQDGCTSCLCRGNGALECVNRTCPSIDYCPEELRYTPEGVCCPTCKVPVCNAQQEERAMNVTVDNGCRECSCKNGDWTCGISKVCPSLSCSEEEKVFEPGQCCPRCGPLQELAGAGAACL